MTAHNTPREKAASAYIRAVTANANAKHGLKWTLQHMPNDAERIAAKTSWVEKTEQRLRDARDALAAAPNA